ncbi:MAG: hypothetical protein QF473_08750 [Planctomycetota bacterium]|jgi:hypothetical protein|nr:hypothetical protein [Planctomycetota bacterium]MDP6505515.1 hypothetical protein [Planctomycetota bacterium]
MVRAVFKNGEVKLISSTPEGWTDGEELVIHERGHCNGGHSLREEFASLCEDWKRETSLHSFSRQIAMHPAYQRIIGLGIDALPLILEDLAKQPHHWFWALRAITGIDPVPDDCQGNIGAMAESWIRWGRKEGLLE